MKKIRWLDWELDVLNETAGAIEKVASGNPDQMSRASELLIVQTLRSAAESRRALLDEGIIKPDPTVPIIT